MKKHTGPVCLLKKRIIEEIRGGRVFFDGYDQSEANKQFYIAIGRENEKGDFIARQRIVFGVQHLSALKEFVLELEAEDAAWLEHG